MGKITVRIREDNHVTRNQICVCSCRVGVPGNATPRLIRKVLQAGFPRPHGSSGIRTVVHRGCLDGLMDMSRIHAFDVGQIVIDEVADEGTTNKALLTELRHVRGLAGNCGGVCHSFITVHEGRIIVISNTGQHIRCIGFQVARNILSDIQIAVIFQPLNVKSCIFQRPKNRIVVHLTRDCLHACSCHSKKHDFFGKKVVYRKTIGIRMIRIISLDCLG